MTEHSLTKTILCYSGGLDSTIAQEYLKPDLVVYFLLRTKYTRKEVRNVRKKNVLIIPGLNLGKYEMGEKAYIPFRNLYLAMLAYSEALIRWPEAKKFRIAIVGVKGDKVEDKSPEAYKEMSKLLNFINKKELPKIEIFSPFWKYTKGQLVRRFKKKIDFRKVISCYSQKSERCGECPACFRFWIALESAGIECWNWFRKDIRRWEGVKEYIQKLDSYDLERKKEMKKVLSKYQLI